LRGILEMGDTFARLRSIIEDLKTSWYFRIWTIVWSVCFILAFVSLIILSARSAEAGTEKDWNMWVENATKIAFPNFHFRFTHHEETQDVFDGSPVCVHEGTGFQLPPTTCTGITKDPTKCQAFPGEVISASNSIAAPFGDDTIKCFINTTGWIYNSTNQMMAFEIEGSSGYDPIDFSPRANPGAWIMLKKRVASPLHSKVQYPFWEKSLLYHSSVKTPGFFVVRVIIGSFRVDHWQQADNFNGWRALDTIGGFSFWMVILHTIVMVIFGIIFANNSKFLNPHGHEEEHGKPLVSSSAAEKQPLAPH